MEKYEYAKGPRQLHSGGIVAPSFEALAAMAATRLVGETGLTMVCGPITTGGTGYQMVNLQVFNACIRGLIGRGKKLFDQVPYEHGLRQLATEWEGRGNSGYCTPILEVFYRRVLSVGAIAEGYFIPGWRSSRGAVWERAWFEEHRCGVYDLTHSDIRAFLETHYTSDHVERTMALVPEA